MTTPIMDIRLDGDNTFPEYKEKAEKGLIITTTTWHVTTLEGGMKSGLPSVAFFFDLPDGRVLFAESSLRAFLSLADVIRAKYSQGRGPGRWA